MTLDLIEQLAAYGRVHEEQQEPLNLPSSDTYLVHTAKHSERGLRPIAGPWAFLAGAVAVLVVGSIALLSNSQPQPTEFNESYLNVSAGEWFDQVVSASNRLGASESVLVGSPGPAPDFDTSSLGNEQRLEPVSDIPVHDWVSIQKESSNPGPFILAGVLPGVFGEMGEPTALGLVKSHTDSLGLVVCTVEVTATGSGRSCDPEQAPMEFGASGATFGTGTQPDVLTIQVPTGSSVVAIDQSGSLSWQRPIGNLAAFVGDFRGASVTVTVYDKDGSVILRSSGSPLS